MIELQEPSDLMVIPERVTPSGRPLSEQKLHCGLGFEKMFDCFDYVGYSKEDVSKSWKIKPQGNSVIGYNNTEIFRLEEFEVKESMTISSDGVFSGIYILDGMGEVDGETVTKGAQFFIPASCNPFKINGKMKIMRFYGPNGGIL